MKFEELNLGPFILRKAGEEEITYIHKNYTFDELYKFYGHSKKEETEKEIKRFEKGISSFNRSFVHFFLVRLESNKTIGWCGYHTWYKDHYRAEIGYVMFDENEKRKGFMNKALTHVIRYGFETMKLHRIEAMAGVDNHASLRLLDQHGFTKEGHLREHYFRNDKPEDSLVFSLLKSEYR